MSHSKVLEGTSFKHVLSQVIWLNNQKNKSDEEEANKILVLKFFHELRKPAALQPFPARADIGGTECLRPGAQ